MSGKMKKRAMREELKDLSAIEVTNFVCDNYHTSEKRNLSSLNQCFRLMPVQDIRNHPELAVVRSYFEEIKKLLQQHLIDSETLYFPAIKRNIPGTYDFTPLKTRIRSVHEVISKFFSQIQSLTHNYTPPADASAWMKLCYALLHDLESDIYSHLFVEESILPLKLGA
jgi:regulator of cell morphogenesis and NO signaling